jgi:hypothetical protein
MCHGLLQIVDPPENAATVDAEIPAAEAGAAVEHEAGTRRSKCHNLGPHQIGKVKRARSLDVEAA